MWGARMSLKRHELGQQGGSAVAAAAKLNGLWRLQASLSTTSQLPMPLDDP